MTVWLVQFILQMRLYVLYKHSKKLLVFMGLAYITQIVVQSTILTLANIGTQTVNEPLPGIYICASTRIPPIFYSFWYAPITFECILCLLALWVGIKRSREEFHLVPIGAGTRLVDVLILGNVLYFVGILLACIANAAIWQSLGSDWLEVAEAFPQAVEVIAGCRLILHIRSAAARRSDDSQTSNIVHYQMQHIALRFADGEE
ncbi:hypothetical protein HYDPIDRAFT_110240 [Hydnomerulius pinastri MD-312]|nr:hypothetical protein HYDPIDRAFT_110240 [Hydnomerulius pinastri MD-312]